MSNLLREALLGSAAPIAIWRGALLGAGKRDGGAPPPDPDDPPQFTAAPTIAGNTAVVGSTLTATPGTVINGTITSRQWYRDGVAIVGATGTSYNWTASDRAKVISYEETATGTAGSVTAEANHLFPNGRYEFNEAAATKVSAMGLDLVFGDDSLQTNGTGGLQKIASAGASMYLGAGAGNRRQVIKVQSLAASGLVSAGLLLTGVSQINGYVFRRNSDTSVRIYRYVNGVPGTHIASRTITGGASELTFEAVVNEAQTEVSLSVYQNGVLVSTPVTDNAYFVGRMGLVGEGAGSNTAAVFDWMETETSLPAGGTGEVQAVAMRYGRQTPAGFGAVSATTSELGLLTSGIVGYWEFKRVSGDATLFPAVTGGSTTPIPLRDIVDGDAGKVIEFDVVIDGVNQGASKRLTITIQPGAGTEPEAAISIASQADINAIAANATLKANLGGKVLEFIKGAGGHYRAGGRFATISLDVPQVRALFDGFSTHTGRFAIRNAPGANPMRGGVHVQNSARIDIDLDIEDNINTWDGTAAGTGGLPAHSDYQNRTLVKIASCSDVTLTAGSTISGRVGTDPTQWITGVEITDTANPLVLQTGLKVLGDMYRVKDGLKGGAVDNFEYSGTIQHFCSNAIFFGGAKLKNVHFHDFTLLDSYLNLSNLGDHPDFMQIGTTGAMANYEDNVFEFGVIGYTAAGQKVSQGPFASDVAVNTSGTGPLVNGSTCDPGTCQKMTGYKFVNTTFRNIIAADASTVHFRLTLGDNYLIERCTGFRPWAPNVTSDLVDPAPTIGKLVENVSGIQHRSGGIIRQCAFHNLNGVVNDTGLWTFADNILFDTEKGGGFTSPAGGTPGGTNETGPTGRQAYYATFFGSTNVQSNDPKVHARPDPAGPLVTRYAGAGVVVGALMPDGSWNTTSRP